MNDTPQKVMELSRASDALVENSGLMAITLSAYQVGPCKKLTKDERALYYAGHKLKRRVCNLDSGAAVSVFPDSWGLKVTQDEYVGHKYITASGERCFDAGQCCMEGFDQNGNPKRLTGRTCSPGPHKALVSAASVVDKNQDIWLGADGGMMMPTDGPIAQGLRQEYERLREQHGIDDLVPVYKEKGVFNFDFWVPTEDKKVETENAKSIAPLEESIPTGPPTMGAAPGFSRQASP